MSRKQGPPEPLSEEHFARLKRKAGLPADRPAEAPEKKRRRTAKGAKAKSATAKAGGKQANSGGKQAKAGIAATAKPQPKTNRKPRGKLAMSELEGSDDDDDDDEDGKGPGDEFDLDAVDSSDGGAEAPALGSDFLGSDSSVVDSDDGEGSRKHVFSEDEDDSEDAEETLTAANMEGLSRRLDHQLAKQAAANEAELAEDALQTNIAGDRPRVLVDEDDEEDEDGGLGAKTDTLLAPDLQLLRTRITDNIRVLDDFGKLAEPGRSRSEYTARLLKDMCAYYGYSAFLAEKLYNLFPPREAFAFFEANETARPVVIRANTLRTHRRDLAQALINRGVTLEPVGRWSKVGLQVFESAVPLGATPEYLAGHYMLQAASSFLPCMALDPRDGERVLDMAAAPGGKTTYMAALMRNTGVIVANDANWARTKALVGNVHRLGATNVVVCNYDAREFPRPMGGFDRVLLDAPCSGTGVIAKDPSVKTNKTELDFLRLPHAQRQLLLAAIDSANHASKTGGFVVYSTCSVTVEENEQVVQYALARRPNVRLVDTGLPFGKPGFTSFMGKRFDPSLRLARRYYPHTYNVDGFFVAKFKKLGPTPPKAAAAADDADAAPQDEPSLRPAAASGRAAATPDSADDFGGWDDDEDSRYMEKGRRNAMRRRGLDPRSDKKAAKKQAATK